MDSLDCIAFCNTAAHAGTSLIAARLPAQLIDDKAALESSLVRAGYKRNTEPSGSLG